jgi:hypothetical protein
MAVTITVGTNSWVTEAEANTYCDARLGASGYWANGAADNKLALITAYTWLNVKYALPVVGTTAIKNAQCEYAIFLLQHQPDLDLRMGLQAQGVVAAGVVKERYKDDNYIELPIPPIVQQLLGDYDTDRPVYLVNLERYEEEGVDYDAYSNLNEDEGAT